MNSPSNRSIPEILSDSVAQLAKLVGNEFDLARAELSEKAAIAGRAAAMIGAGAVILVPALVVLLFAASSALVQIGLSEPVAYFIVGVGAALLSAVLVWMGVKQLSGGALKPTITIEQVQRDKTAAKEMVR